jgi:hypothetical protein
MAQVSTFVVTLAAAQFCAALGIAVALFLWRALR